MLISAPIWYLFVIFAEKYRIMRVVTAREFRANQSKILTAARDGQSVMLTSRVGNFKIVPITEDDTITDRICHGLEQVKLIREGKAKGYTVDELLDEL